MPLPTLLIVGMRNVECDWSATGDTQKLTNQSGEQIQVVNPEPAFDCSAPSSQLYPGVEFLALTRFLLAPEPPLKTVTLVLGKQESLKMI